MKQCGKLFELLWRRNRVGPTNICSSCRSLITNIAAASQQTLQQLPQLHNKHCSSCRSFTTNMATAAAASKQTYARDEVQEGKHKHLPASAAIAASATTAMGSDQFCLKWTNYQNNMVQALGRLKVRHSRDKLYR